LLPVPSALGKGVLLSPTIFGNLIAGPTAEDMPLGSSEATQTTREGLLYVKSQAELVSLHPFAWHGIVCFFSGIYSNACYF
jgi:glycerol-3-phosphate dehydrogenase